MRLKQKPLKRPLQAERRRTGRAHRGDPELMSNYDKAAVDAAIAQSNRAGRKIGKKEARLIHALLKGRQK
jgi:hypothetical protein